jgi:hypothetical protein
MPDVYMNLPPLRRKRERTLGFFHQVGLGGCSCCFRQGEPHLTIFSFKFIEAKDERIVIFGFLDSREDDV